MLGFGIELRGCAYRMHQLHRLDAGTGRAPDDRRAAKRCCTLPFRRRGSQLRGHAYDADPEFHTFLKTLESYGVLGDDTTLMINANSDFFGNLESTLRR